MRVRITLAGWTLIAATLVTLGGTTPARAGDCPPGDPRYGAPIQVPTLGGTSGSAAAVNDLDPPAVAGQATDADGNGHAIRWRPGGGTPFDLGAAGVFDLNDDLVAVGSRIEGPNPVAVVWSASGERDDLPRLPVGAQTYAGQAYSINEDGQIAGTEWGHDSANSPADSLHAVRWDDASTVVDLHETGLGWANDTAVAINESAQIAGYWRSAHVQTPHSYGVRWDGANATDLPGPDVATDPTAINDAGKIVGTHAAEGSGPPVAVVWVPGGADPIELSHPGVDYAAPTAINNSDHIVGHGGPFPGFAVVWLSNGHGAWSFNDLNCLIPKDSGWNLTAAADINERGDIVGTGTNPAGQTRGFLLRLAASDLLDLSVANSAGIEGSSARVRATPPTGKIVFTIRRSGIGTASSVHYATVAGTAKSGIDYTAVQGTLQFTKTQRTKTVTVLLKRDHRDEPNETFSLKLSRAVDAHIADGTGVGTIRDDD